MLDPENENVFAYTRNTAEERLLVVCNFTAEAQPEVLPDAFLEAEVLLANYPDPTGTLRPYETRMLRVKA